MGFDMRTTTDTNTRADAFADAFARIFQEKFLRATGVEVEERKELSVDGDLLLEVFKEIDIETIVKRVTKDAIADAFADSGAVGSASATASVSGVQDLVEAICECLEDTSDCAQGNVGNQSGNQTQACGTDGPVDQVSDNPQVANENEVENEEE